MFDPPATPDKAGTGVTKSTSIVGMHHSEKLASTSKEKQASPYEPSPASTYGDSADGNSTPATPGDGGDQDVTVGITQSLRAAQLDPAIQSISHSPMAAIEAKGMFMRIGSRSDDAAFAKVNNTSPSKATGFDFVQRNGSTSSSPNTDRIKEIRESPTWRGHHEGSFVRQSGNQSDDPFVSNGSTAQSPGQGTGAAYRVREDRAGTTPSSNTAQALFGPEACVFVANLTQSDTDEQLDRAVTEAFAQYGPVYVKIRRDGRGMPFAFAQFEAERDAQRAITMGHGTRINGRPCRTEVARVNRSLYLSLISGGQITEDNAREILAGCGAIEALWYTSPTDREMYRLPEGVWVRFHYFDDCRDAQLKFRNHAQFRLEQPKMPGDMRARVVGRSVQSPMSALNTTPLDRRSPGRLFSPPSGRYGDDACSIFVGNLPPTITEQHLNVIFQMYGPIRHIEIVRKPSLVGATGVNVFAFIEFAGAADAVIAARASPTYQGFRLRVEAKESSNHLGRNSTGSGGSPRTRFPAETQDMLMMLYQRGVSVGMTQAVQSQAAPPPVYAQYPYYQPYDANLTQYAGASPGVNNDGSLGLQSYGNAYMQQPAGQVQYPQAPTTYVQYQPAQEQSIQQPNYSNLPNYQWPLSNTGNENATPSMGVISHNTR